MAGYSSAKAIEILKEGNKKYINSAYNPSDISLNIRKKTYEHGQNPYAIIISCSDSRVIPEDIFMTGIGELFVIRIAGNVIDDHQLGSIEYAADHLNAPLILVLGHTHCGAVDAAINHSPDGYIKFITDEIKAAIGEETDPIRASELNVKRSIDMIESSLEIRELEHRKDLKVIGAMYDIESGEVRFL
ncbi:MAG: carbonic anhydrase [bacterium]|nr:carbonic anhydrase [bacterium]